MQKTVCFIIACCLIILPSTMISADEFLKWEEIVAKTIELQPELKSAAWDVEAARYDKEISRSALLPQITGASTFSRADSSSKDWVNSYTHNLSASWLLFDGLKTPYAVKAARKRINEQQFAYDVTSSDVLLDVRTAFINLMESQKQIALTESIRDRKKQNLELVQLRYEGGKEHRGAYLTAEADLAQADFDVREAGRDLVLSRRRLWVTMGSEQMQDTSVAGEFRLSDLYIVKPDLNRMLDNIPFLNQLAAARDAAMLDKHSAKGEIWPSVSAVNSLSKSDDAFWGDEKRALSFGISVSVPFFEGGRNVATIKKSHVTFLRAQATEQSGRRQVLLTLEEDWKSLQDAVETVSVRQKFLTASEERAKIAAAQYGTGLIDFDDWIIIENNLVSAQKNYLSAQAGMLQAEAEWIHSLGGTIHEKIY